MRFQKVIFRLALFGSLTLFAGARGNELNWESSATRDKAAAKVAEVDSVIQQDTYKDDWQSLKAYQPPDWYRDAKFGIFIHWGLYSVPGYANEWYSRNMYQQGDDAFKHHVSTYGPQTKFGYKDFIPLFKAEKFDAHYWADLFKKAGAKYVVPVAEHHDGFAMYDSEFSDWTAKKIGPKRDVIGELAQAVRSEGLVFGLSSHRAEHWWFMNGGMKFDSDVQDPKYSDFYGPARPDDTAPDEEYLSNWLARSSELVDKYHPQLVYFDWWVGEKPVFDPFIRKFAAYYYDRAAEWKEGVVLNTKDKAFVPGTSIQDVEKGKLPGINPDPWQTDTSVSWKSWAYLKDDSLKDAGYLIRSLIDTVSRNGNLLLDIGPKPDGTIPPEQEKILLQIGDWLRVNGEAIYGTRPWITYGEGPTKVEGGKFSESDVKYQEGDVRYTWKGNALYVICMVPPTLPVTLESLGSMDIQVNKVSLLGSAQNIHWNRLRNLLILAPPSVGGDRPIVFKMELGGFTLGSWPVQTHGNQYTVSGYVQNYGTEKITIPIRLLDGPKKLESREVTVEPGTEHDFTFTQTYSNPGMYQACLGYELKGKNSTQTSYNCWGIGLPSIELTGEWLFSKGDDPSWKITAYDDQAWDKVKLPCKWEDFGYVCDHCYGWYRLHLKIPKEWKGHGLILPLGKIDDADITYFNGKEISRMGDEKTTAWNQERRYKVPAEIIKYGWDNVIAIRVYNITGGAGLYDGPLGPVEVK